MNEAAYGGQVKAEAPGRFPPGAFYLSDVERLDVRSLPAPYMSMPHVDAVHAAVGEEARRWVGRASGRHCPDTSSVLKHGRPQIRAIGTLQTPRRHTSQNERRGCKGDLHSPKFCNIRTLAPINEAAPAKLGSFSLSGQKTVEEDNGPRQDQRKDCSAIDSCRIDRTTRRT